MLLYLLRHGIPEVPESGMLVGQIDLPLSGRGAEQARHWSRALPEASRQRVYCSDLLRSLQTGRILADNQEGRIQIIPRLREISLGAWDGSTREALATRFPGEWARRQQDIVHHRPPGGESFSDLQSRVIPAFAALLDGLTDDSVMVGHAAVNRIIISSILGMPLENMFRIKQDYGALTILEKNGATVRVAAMNLPPGSLG